LVAHVRALFDLDADPVAIDEVLRRVPALEAAVQRTPGIRVPGTVDPHELVIRAIVGQQVSVAAARTALASLVSALGEKAPGDIASNTTMFPTMAAIAAHGAEVLRGPQRRVDTVVRTAAALAEGSLVVDRASDMTELRASLQALSGIGPWTANYIGLRVRQLPDILVPGDSAIRAGARALGLSLTDRELTDWASSAAPWRSYLTMHLWRAAGAAMSPPAPHEQPPSTSNQEERSDP
jgi:AraC family transcriptional regulator of adaptative response / DNA-3-methyladenine glycosylase II